jgi:hypothetical protein
MQQNLQDTAAKRRKNKAHGVSRGKVKEMD